MGKSNSSSPPMRPANGSRRQAYVSVNHELLNFEVTSKKEGSSFGGGGSSGSGRRSGRNMPAYSKERFIHANFRFLSRIDPVGLSNHPIQGLDPDAILEWNYIDLVIVPTTGEVRCPICLDRPLAPRLTRCGHFFCWPCILRYAESRDLNGAKGAGNWRDCPICAENVNVRQIKAVHFVPVTDFASNMIEISEIGIPMVLLKGSLCSSRVSLVDGPSGGGSATVERLEDLNPFDKVTFVSHKFLIEQVCDEEIRQLRDRLTKLDDSEEEKNYVELSLSMADDIRSHLFTEAEGRPQNEACPKIDNISGPTWFFHQSIDGQPYFLCPLSIKMLRKHFGNYSSFPPFLCAPVVEIEMFMMTEEVRKRHKYLHHMPLGCQFGLCEVDLSGVVSGDVLEEFKAEVRARKDIRKRKRNKEDQLALKARQMEEGYLTPTIIASGGWDDCLSPGVAVSVLGFNAYWEDYENFPVFEGESPGKSPEATVSNDPAADIGEAITATAAVPINKPAKKNSLGLASSFASVAATSPMNPLMSLVATTPISDHGHHPSRNAYHLDVSLEDVASAMQNDHQQSSPSLLGSDCPAMPTTTAIPSSSRRNKKLVIASTNSKRQFL